MTATLRSLGIVQSLALLALGAILLWPRAPLSIRLRVPAALIALVSSAAHLILTIL